MATWTALTYAYGSLLTSTKMTQNQDNFTALTEKASGAPVLANGYVVEAILATSAVAQGKLKTTTASGSVNVVARATATYALTGGTYSWWTAGAGTGGNDEPVGFSAGNTAAGTLGLMNLHTSDQSFYVDERYVQASPPYNNGPLFVHLAFDSNGNIKHSRVAPDPIHAYHGPTDITPQSWRGDKAFRLVKKINGLSMHAALRDPLTLRALMTGAATITEEEVEITLAYKDSDMAVMPHPFVGNDLTGLTVVMLEPGTALMARLADFCDCGAAREVRNLVLDGKLIIDNTALAIPNTPPGVMAVRARWKLT